MGFETSAIPVCFAHLSLFTRFRSFLRVFWCSPGKDTKRIYAKYCDNSIAQYIGCNLDVSEGSGCDVSTKSPICCSCVPLATPAPHCNPCTHFCSFAAPLCVVDCASVIPPQQKWREATKKSGRVIEGVLPANIHTHTHTQSQPDVSYINCTPLSTKSSAQVTCVIHRWQFHKSVELTNESYAIFLLPVLT